MSTDIYIVETRRASRNGNAFGELDLQNCDAEDDGEGYLFLSGDLQPPDHRHREDQDHKIRGRVHNPDNQKSGVQVGAMSTRDFLIPVEGYWNTKCPSHGESKETPAEGDGHDDVGRNPFFIFSSILDSFMPLEADLPERFNYKYALIQQANGPFAAKHSNSIGGSLTT